MLFTDDVQIYSGPAPIEKRIHIYLYYIGNNAYSTEISDKFAVSSPMTYVYQIANIINKCLYKRLVQWPINERKVQGKLQFEDFSGYKIILGAIDGTHVVCNCLA